MCILHYLSRFGMGSNVDTMLVGDGNLRRIIRMEHERYLSDMNGSMKYDTENPYCKYDELSVAVIRYGIQKLCNENLMSLMIAAYPEHSCYVFSYEAGTRDILDKVAFYIHIYVRARVVDLWGGKSRWGRDKFKEEFMRLLPEDREEEE